MSAAERIGIEFGLHQVINPPAKQSKAYSAKFCHIPGYESFFAVVGSSAPNAVCIYKFTVSKEIELVQYYVDEEQTEVIWLCQ